MGGLIALLLVGGGAFAGWWFLLRGPTVAQFIPGNGQGFVSIRVADIWKANATKAALAKLKEFNPQAADFEKKSLFSNAQSVIESLANSTAPSQKLSGMCWLPVLLWRHDSTC